MLVGEREAIGPARSAHGGNDARREREEERYRAESHNDDERTLRIVTSVEKTEGWNVPITGGVSRPALEQVIEELTTFGELQGPLPVEAVLRDEFVRAAYEDVSTRPSLQPAQQKALAAVEKYGL